MVHHRRHVMDQDVMDHRHHHDHHRRVDHPDDHRRRRRRRPVHLDHVDNAKLEQWSFLPTTS